MPVYVALLRGINVGGRKLVAMSLVRELYSTQTLLQSGNVVFKAGRRTGAAIERLLEQQIVERLGVAADCFVRTATEWKSILVANPFPVEAQNDPGHLVLMCLKAPPQTTALKHLAGAFEGDEQIRACGRQLYILYPDGIGRSKLTSKLIEQTLATRGTARNWNTVRKIAAVLD